MLGIFILLLGNLARALPIILEEEKTKSHRVLDFQHEQDKEAENPHVTRGLLLTLN